MSGTRVCLDRGFRRRLYRQNGADRGADSARGFDSLRLHHSYDEDGPKLRARTSGPPSEGSLTVASFAIKFDYPEGDTLYAGMHKGALGWAQTIATALIYDNEETARRVLENGYGSQAKYGRVVAVEAEKVA